MLIKNFFDIKVFHVFTCCSSCAVIATTELEQEYVQYEIYGQVPTIYKKKKSALLIFALVFKQYVGKKLVISKKSTHISEINEIRYLILQCTMNLLIVHTFETKEQDLTGETILNLHLTLN